MAEGSETAWPLCLRFLKLPEAHADKCLVTCVAAARTNNPVRFATHEGVAATTPWRSSGRIDEV